MAALIDYLAEQLSHGYAPQDLRNVLLKQGYASSEIQEAFAALEQDRVGKLQSYILRNGGMAQQAEIRGTLEQLGYADRDIDRAFAQVAERSAPITPSVTHSHWKLVVLLALAIVAVFVYPMLHLPSTPSPAPLPHTFRAVPQVAEAPIELQAAPAPKQGNADRDSAIAFCRSVPDAVNRNACIDQLAKSFDDPTLCAEVQDIGARDTCYLTLALRDKNYALCTSISDQRVQRECSDLQSKFL